MEELVASALKQAPEGARIDALGSALSLRSEVAVALGLALHELLTNAVRFGALSIPNGRVELRWRPIEGAPSNQHVIEWREIGGPNLAGPTKSGLGCELLKNILPPQLGGETDLRFDRGGVSATIAFTP